MRKRMARFTARSVTLGVVLALLVLTSSFATAQPRSTAAFFVQVAKLTALDGVAHDYFGHSVSISGDTAVVGAPEDDDSGDDSGAAYLFERNEGGLDHWGQVVKLTASDGAAYDRFGHSVSISDDTVVITAPKDDDNGDYSGSAYLFERNEGGPGNWGQVAKLTASDGDEWDEFGASVSIGGDTVVVGVPFDDDNGDYSGSAYLYEKPPGGWTNMTETAKLTASDGVFEDFFGCSMSISGDTVVAGAHGDDDGGFLAGSAYVYKKPQTGWADMTETAKLSASDSAGGDHFGYSVSISGDTVVVGAFGDDEAVYDSGSVYLFERPVTGWENTTETAKLTASDCAAHDEFGRSVSISSDILVASAPQDDDNGEYSGSAYLFENPEAGWADMTETAKFTASDGAEDDSFGGSVSIGRDTLVIGAPNDDDDGDSSGSAYLFVPIEPATWVYLPVVLCSAP